MNHEELMFCIMISEALEITDAFEGKIVSPRPEVDFVDYDIGNEKV